MLQALFQWVLVDPVEILIAGQAVCGICMLCCADDSTFHDLGGQSCHCIHIGHFHFVCGHCENAVAIAEGMYGTDGSCEAVVSHFSHLLALCLGQLGIGDDAADGGVFPFAAGRDQSWLLGAVLLLIAVGMPAVYVGMFLSGVKGQAKKLKLPRRVYTLNFSAAGVHIVNNLKPDEQVDLDWKKIPAAFRCKNAIYLYAAPSRAFILPEGQADAPTDELWAMMEKHLRKGPPLKNASTKRTCTPMRRGQVRFFVSVFRQLSEAKQKTTRYAGGSQSVIQRLTLLLQ